MKHIYLALSLGLLLLTTACIDLSGKRENNGNQFVTKPIENDNTATQVAPMLTQNYYTMDEDQPAIVGEVKDGGLWLTFFKDEILPLQITDEDAYRLPDRPVKVEGLQGAPKEFIIADIGQDYNPVLCVLTDKGKVQLLSLWNTVSTGDLEVTEIPMEPIVKFEAGPGGPWEDEGEIYYDYTTIYGIDAQGGDHEIPMYLWERSLEYVDPGQNADVVYQLFLNDDWKMRYVMGYHFSEKLEELQGRFWIISEDWDEMTFTYGYELTTRMEYTGEGIETTAVKKQGVFEMRYPEVGGQSCFITPIEGVDFCNKGLDKPVFFNPCGAYGG